MGGTGGIWMSHFSRSRRRCATRDHEPQRGEGSALPIRLGLAATRLETSAFALCATAVSRRCRRVPAAHSGFFAAPGHETPPSRRTKFHESILTWKAAILVATGRDGSTSSPPSTLNCIANHLRLRSPRRGDPTILASVSQLMHDPRMRPCPIRPVRPGCPGCQRMMSIVLAQ